MYDVCLALANPIGIIGVIIILIAYLLLSTGHWSAHGLKYQVLNFVGAWMILFSLYFYWNLSSVLIEIAWILISIYGMYKAVAMSKKKAS